MKMLL